MIKVEKKGDGTLPSRNFLKSRLRRSRAAAGPARRPLLFALHDQRTERRARRDEHGRPDQVEDRSRPPVRSGSILAEGLLLMTEGGAKLYLVEPNPAGLKPLASAVILEPGP